MVLEERYSLPSHGTKDWAQRSVSMWIRKEIKTVPWKNYTPLKLLQF